MIHVENKAVCNVTKEMVGIRVHFRRIIDALEYERRSQITMHNVAWNTHMNLYPVSHDLNG